MFLVFFRTNLIEYYTLNKSSWGGTFRRQAIESSFERFYAINENLYDCIWKNNINRKCDEDCYPVSKASPLVSSAPRNLKKLH